jgi:purine-cytosine permease-like protein
MASGLFASDCSSSDWAWIDFGCVLQNIGTTVGTSVTSALEPVWIVLAIVVVLVVIILFAPNTKHIVPHIAGAL